MKATKLIRLSIIIIMLSCLFVFYRESYTGTISKLLPISKVNTDEKIVAIACNVYEGREELNKILEVLNKKKIHISFFIGGVWAQKNKDMLLKLKNSGHDIQNHGYNHKLPSTLSKEKNIKEIKATEELIYSVTGIRTTLFEPPSGDYDENTLSIVNSLGYKTVTWSIDTIDWRKDATSELILGRVKKKLHPGGIILIHPKPVTAQTIESLLDYLELEGYKVTSVSDLIEYK